VSDLRTISEIAPLVQSGEVSPVDLVAGCLQTAEARSSLNAFITLMADQARAEARQAAAEIASGHYRGPLHGIPIAIKDLIDVAGTKTTSGSALSVVEVAGDAPVITRLREAGAIIIGKTNLHEFAFGTTSDETAFGPVRHPLDPSRSGGGSSGGSAVALATGMAFGALGTDTGGSIRIPSAVCGVVGLKPALGEVPVAGVVPLSGTLDHVGPMARSVADVALLHQVLTGARLEARRQASPITFGIPRPYFCDVLDAGTAAALERVSDALAAAGHRVIDVRIDDAEWTPHVYLHIVLPEATWYHAPWLGPHADRYSPGVRIRLEMGGYILGEDYVRAMRLRERLRARVDAALDHCDALLLPTQPMGAPPIGAATVEIGGTPVPVRAAMLRLTQLFNITGHPATALPAGAGRDGLPRSVQVAGRSSAAVLAISREVERYSSGGAGSVGGGTG
jgi:aspartyl-tRNA(Asn)/glutamyl-tRNA(Gln) amidotransferase subunit A